MNYFIRLFILILILPISVSATSSWWNYSWNYRTDNVLVDSVRPYQLQLNISNSTGTNNATNIFCNGQCNVNFTDIRFTLDNTTILSYWIEEKSSGKIWINVTGNGTVNMYYGNSAANISTQNGSATFRYFDNTFTNIGANPILDVNNAYAWEVPATAQNRWGSIAYNSTDNIWYMFYTNGSNTLTGAIGRATSSDLKTWNKEATPVMYGAGAPEILRELDGSTPRIINNSVYMTVRKGVSGSCLQLFNSTGLKSNTWTVANSTLICIKAGTGYNVSVFTNSFVYDPPTDKYYIFFEGNNGTQYSIFYASSSTVNGTYIVNDTAILNPTESWQGGALDDPVVRYYNNQYYLFYTANGTSTTNNFNNSYATSSTITGTYTESHIAVNPLKSSYPEIFYNNSNYYIITDDRDNNQIKGKRIYKSPNINGMFPMAYDWNFQVPVGSSSGTYTIGTNQITLTNAAILTNKLQFGQGYAMRTNITTGTDVTGLSWGGFTTTRGSSSNINFTSLFARNSASAFWKYESANDTSAGDYQGSYAGAMDSGVSHTFEAKRDPLSDTFIMDNYPQIQDTKNMSSALRYPEFYSYSSDLKINWVLVRNYVSSEPQWITWNNVSYVPTISGLSGIIRDEKSNQISGVSITTSGILVATTDSTGLYSTGSIFFNGTYPIVYSKDGYTSYSTSTIFNGININLNQDITLNRGITQLRTDTCSGILYYVNISIPLFGLALMILGVSVSIITLKSSKPSGTIILSSLILIIFGFAILLVGNYMIYAITNITC